MRSDDDCRVSLSIYQLEHSPYCIPVTRALEALGVPFEAKNVSNADRSEIIRLTNGAYYQVPVLVHDGRVIFESSPGSTDIAHYVDREFAGGRLYPKEHEGLQRLVIAHIEDDIEGVTFRLVDPFYLQGIADLAERTMIIRHKERKFGAGCVAKWSQDREALLAEAERLLEPYELILRGKPFLFGDTPLYSDFALYGVLGNMTWRDHNSLPATLSASQAWFTKMTTFRFA